MRRPDIIGQKLCGFVLAADAPPDAMPKADCIAITDVASSNPSLTRATHSEAVDAAVCIVLAPICLAKVSEAQNRLTERAIERAK